MEPATKRASSILSKKRYHEIHDMLRRLFGDDERVDQAMAEVQEIMHFDPHMSTYTPELGQRKLASLKKRCEETGKSTYQILHAKRLQAQGTKTT
jgi:hypothetical protein